MEAKQRRTTALAADEENALDGIGDSDRKAPRISFVERRGGDVFAVSWYWVSNVFGWWYMNSVLLDEGVAYDVAFVFLPFYYMVMIPFNIAWVTMVYCGSYYEASNIVSTKPQGILSQPLIAALNVGRHSNSRPFTADVAWCNACNCSKPALVHHCHVCQRCVLWMDHHCNFAGVCIGFQNLRTYLVWLSYGLAMHAGWFLLTALRLLARLPVNRWDWFHFIAWCYVLWRQAATLQNFYRSTVTRLSYGWASEVLWTKFGGVRDAALEEKKKLKGAIASGRKLGWDISTARAAEKMLSEAFESCHLPGGRDMRGLFARGLSTAFRQSFSWRWFLPFAVGGPGDPFKPEESESSACESWANLDNALNIAKAASKELSQRILEFKQEMNSNEQRMTRLALSIEST